MDIKTDPEIHVGDSPEKSSPQQEQRPLEQPLENTGKSRWERTWPTIACGAGLFSDGYLNGVRICLPS